MKRKTNRPRHRRVTFLPPIVCVYIYIYISRIVSTPRFETYFSSFFFFFLFHLGSYACARYPDIGSKVRTGGEGGVKMR